MASLYCKKMLVGMCRVVSVHYCHIRKLVQFFGVDKGFRARFGAEWYNNNVTDQ